jgi:hypothetical protein
MADFAKWGEAISQALGHQPGEFLKAYMENIGRQHRTVLEENPIGLAILKLIEQAQEYSGSPSQLLSKLEEVAEQSDVDTHSKMWPGSAVWVTRRIKKIETNLEAQGVDVDLGHTGANRVITLRRNQNWPSANSINGINSISRTKQMTNRHDNHHEDDMVSHQDCGKNTVNTVIPLESFTKLLRLTSLVEGECAKCGFQGGMDWQVTMPDGNWHLLCEKCGFELTKKT